MSLFFTFILNGLAVGVRTLTALLLNKLLAIYVGPAGYAVMGQFQNIVSMATIFVTGGMQNGVTKFTAEYYDDEQRQQRLWRTTVAITLIGSAIVIVLIVPFRALLAAYVLHDRAYSGVFIWLAVSVFFLGLNSLFLAILNGKKEASRYVIANICGSFLSLVLTGFLAWRYGVYGALVALSINQSALFFVAAWLCRGKSWFRLGAFWDLKVPLNRAKSVSDHLRNTAIAVWKQIDPVSLRGLMTFSIMGGTTAIAGSLSQILIRNHLRLDFGWDYAGCWEAITRVSQIYLSLATMTLFLYYLPRVAEIRVPAELRREIFKVFRVLIPATVVASATMYLMRHFIIRVLFTAKFAPMEQLFGYQMIGDVVRISGYVLQFVLIGRGWTRWFVITEAASFTGFWILSLVLTPLFGYPGVSFAYILTYVLWLAGLYYIVFHSRTGKAHLA